MLTQTRLPKPWTAVFAGLGLCLSLCVAAAARAEAQDCHVGAYRLQDGSFVDIAPSVGPTLRWRRFDGRTGALHRAPDGAWQSTFGWTDRPDGLTVSFPDCASGKVRFGALSGQRIAFDVTNTTFQGRGVRLEGRLVMPRGVRKAPVVVLLHGSEPDSALDGYALQRMLPAEGVGVFVYDKRGTGASGGAYTQDFDLLADDAVAAIKEARRLAGPRAGRVGYQAGSQGGWIAPMAVNRTPADFAIICFGLAVTVIDEDQQAIELQLREKGYTPEEIAQAQEVGRAAEAVFESGFTRGFETFDAVRAKYGHARWYKDLHGDFTFFLLPLSTAELRAMGPKFEWHTPFRYDPMPALRQTRTPQLWILGGEDYEAPSAETSRRIEGLIRDGAPFTLALYKDAEHGITLFETAPDGSRLSTRYAPGYFAMIRDFVRHGRLTGAYGDARITRPKVKAKSSAVTP